MAEQEMVCAGAGDEYPRPSALYVGESWEEYEEVRRYFFDTVRPAAGTEAMLVSTMVDLTREIHQLEKARATLIRFKLRDLLVELMTGTEEDATPEEEATILVAVARRWALEGRGSDVDVAERLAVNQLSLEAVMRHGYALALDEMKQLNGLIERAELRRDRVLRTFDNSRALRALVRVRDLQIRRAEFALIDAPPSLGIQSETDV